MAEVDKTWNGLTWLAHDGFEWQKLVWVFASQEGESDFEGGEKGGGLQTLKELMMIMLSD